MPEQVAHLVQALRESERHFRLLAEHATDIITRRALDGTCLYCSPAVREVLGWEPEEAVGSDLLDIVHPEDRGLARRLLAELLRTRCPQSLRHRALHRDGRLLWLETVGRAVVGPDGDLEVQTSTRDVTARVEAERRLARLALSDPLTGLANRAALVQRLEDLLAAGAPVAVLLLDLDRFQVVNDSLGHANGDELLRAVAARLTALGGPRALVARLGGDEFALVVPDLDQPVALALAEQVLSVLREPLPLGRHETVVSAGIGVVLAPPGPDREAEELLRDADIAMYRAKARGRGAVVVWNERLGSAARRRLDVERELRAALEEVPGAGQLVVHYQPQVDLLQDRLLGVEALVRWEHPTRGLLLPAEFLDIADDTGLVVDLGRRVVRTAVRDVAAWRTLPGHADLTLSVNVSAAELQRPGTATECGAVLRAAGLPPSCVTVEVLESVLLDAEGTVEAGLAAYADLGVKLALDDFGTGHSSLLHLRQVPVSTVKVDRTFVAGLGSSPRDEAIVRALCVLAAELGLSCVAEGVERPEQRRWLAGHGVRLAQGFLLSRPLPAAQVLDLLRAAPGPSASPR